MAFPQGFPPLSGMAPPSTAPSLPPPVDGSATFSLCCSNHNNTVSTAYYRLFRAGKYCDVTVCCADRQYDCHRLVLAGNSAYFARVFERAECPKPVVVLHEVPGRIFERLLEYMYTGRSEVCANEMGEVLHQAHGLQIDGLEVGDAQLNQLNSLDLGEATGYGATVKVNSKKRKKNSVETATSVAAAAPTLGNNGAAALLQAAEAISIINKSKAEGSASSHHKSRKGQPKRLVARAASPDPEEESRLVIDDSPVDFSQSASPPPQDATIAPALPLLAGRGKGSILDKMLHERTRNASADGDMVGSPLPPPVSAAAPSLEYLSLLQAQQKQVEVAAAAAAAKEAGIEKNGTDDSAQRAAALLNNQFDIGAMIRRMYMNPQAEQLMMNQTAAAAITNNSSGGEEDVEKVGMEEEAIMDEEMDNGTFTPPPSVNGSGKRRPSGRPASASIARDEYGNPKLGPNGKPMVACEVCGKELADPSSLYRHRKIHSGEKPHACPFCPHRFIQRYNMRQHLKTHKSKGLITKEDIEKLEPDLREVFTNNMNDISLPPSPPEHDAATQAAQAAAMAAITAAATPPALQV